MDFFTCRDPETLVSVKLPGVSRPLEEGTLIEVVFDHVSGIVPGYGGNIVDSRWSMGTAGHRVRQPTAVFPAPP